MQITIHDYGPVQESPFMSVGKMQGSRFMGMGQMQVSQIMSMAQCKLHDSWAWPSAIVKMNGNDPGKSHNLSVWAQCKCHASWVWPSSWVPSHKYGQIQGLQIMTGKSDFWPGQNYGSGPLQISHIISLMQGQQIKSVTHFKKQGSEHGQVQKSQIIIIARFKNHR